MSAFGGAIQNNPSIGLTGTVPGLAIPFAPQMLALGSVASGDIPLGVGPASISRSVSTPYGAAVQSTEAPAISALANVQSGATVYRAGSFGVQNTTDAQFWSLQNPATTVNYANKMGMPGSSSQTFDWIMGGTLNPGATAITRSAPSIGGNTGGQIETVVNPGGVGIQWFHMP